MSTLFKKISCPTCGRSLRYPTSSASEPIQCGGCKARFAPNDVSGSSGGAPPVDSGDDTDEPRGGNAKRWGDAESRSGKLPRWARDVPIPPALTHGGIETLGDQPDNANTTWAGGDADGSGGSGFNPEPIHGFGTGRGGGKKTLAGALVGVLALGVVGWMYSVPTTTPQVLPSAEKTPAPKPPEGDAPATDPEPPAPTAPPAPPAPTAPTDPLAGVVAKVTSAMTHIYAIEEYVWDSLNANSRDTNRAPHFWVQITGLAPGSKVRFSIKCENTPKLIREERKSENPFVADDGSVQTDFAVWIPWNISELTSIRVRDPLLELSVECFVDEKSACLETLKVHFNEVFVLLNTDTLYSAAYVQPDHPAIKDLIEKKYAPLDRNLDRESLAKSIGEVVEKEVRSEVKDPAEAAARIPSDIEREKTSAVSMLQAFFVWKLVDSLKIKYQNLSNDDAAGGHGNQQLRTVSVVLKDKTGNCIEESLLFASLFHKTHGVSLIFPPGHCMAMAGRAFDFFDSIPLECTRLGAEISMKMYQDIVTGAKQAHGQSGLGRFARLVELMPAKMRRVLEADPYWRSFASAIESGTEQLADVFTYEAVVEAWTKSGLCSSCPTDEQRSKLNEEETKQAFKRNVAEMDAWFEKNDTSNHQIIKRALDGDNKTAHGIAYWYMVCKLAGASRDGITHLDNYIPIESARKMGIVALPNEAGESGKPP